MRTKASRKLKKCWIVILTLVTAMIITIGTLEYRSSPNVQVSSLIDLQIPRDSTIKEQLDMMGGLPAEGEVYYLFKIPEDKMSTLVEVAIKKDWKPFNSNMQAVLNNMLVDPRIPPIPTINNGIYVFKNINTRVTNRDFVVGIIDKETNLLYVYKAVR